MDFDETSILILLTIVLLTLLSIPLSPRIPDVHPLFLSSQSDAAKVRNEGESVVYRNTISSTPPKLIGVRGKEICHLLDLWDEAVALGGRFIDDTLVEMALADLDSQMRAFGRGLVALGAKKGNRLAILAKPSVRWIVAEMGSLSQGLTTIGLETNVELDTNEQSAYLRSLGISIVVLDGEHVRQKDVLKLAGIKTIICIDNDNLENVDQEIVSWTALIKNGQSSTPAEVIKATSAAIFAKSYCNREKVSVVSFTHRNLLSSTSTHASWLTGMHPDTTHLRFMTSLPLWDIRARVSIYAALLKGATICLTSGSPATLLTDAQSFQPTHVQTIAEAVASIYDIVSTLYDGFLFRFAMNRKDAILRQGCTTRQSFWDKLFLSLPQRILGDQLRAVQIIEGDMDRSILNSMRSVLGYPVTTSYTRIEAGGLVTTSHLYDYNDYGEGPDEHVHVGPPANGLELKLKRVNETGRASMEGVEDGADPIGEIMVRGPMIATSCYTIPGDGRVERVLDKEGWFATGDVGQIFSNGTLKLLGTKLDYSSDFL